VIASITVTLDCGHELTISADDFCEAVIFTHNDNCAARIMWLLDRLATVDLNARAEASEG
jgi:hypothetical protein